MWLITGGCGYIGSHVVRSFLEHGADVVVLDDLSTGTVTRLPEDVPLRIAKCSEAPFVLEDLGEGNLEGIVHLAGLKDPRESMRQPLRYWDANFAETLALVQWASELSVPNFVFSSSSSVYGPKSNADVGDDPNPVSTYGETKLAAEKLLDSVNRLGSVQTVALRYFNVIGAGEFTDACDTGSDNLIPRFANALAKNGPLPIYGSDHPTPDGTCIRDYIDVRDLAEAHWVVAQRMSKDPQSVPRALNVSRGDPVSVRTVATIIKDLKGQQGASLLFLEAAPGDPPLIFGSPSKCLEDWGWKPQRTLTESIADHLTRMSM